MGTLLVGLLEQPKILSVTSQKIKLRQSLLHICVCLLESSNGVKVILYTKNQVIRKHMDLGKGL